MEHLDQIQRAIDYIEDHLNDELSVEQIARVAAFSRWHFQIVFSSVIGETLKEYIRKRRLSLALISLSSTDQRIIEIAVNSGFDSQESFTRAFKNQFGLTPGDYRKNGAKDYMILHKPKITMEYLDHLYEGINMQPVFKKLPEFKVIGIGEKFISILSPEKNNHIVIPKLWDRYIPRRNEIKSRVGLIDFGVCMPAENKNHSDECFYMACAEVNDSEVVPVGMIAKTIPAGEYAVFTHKGFLNKLDHTMNYIYGAWLPKSGRKLREAPDLELYDSRFNPSSEKSEFDIYIPIS